MSRARHLPPSLIGLLTVVAMLGVVADAAGELRSHDALSSLAGKAVAAQRTACKAKAHHHKTRANHKACTQELTKRGIAKPTAALREATTRPPSESVDRSPSAQTKPPAVPEPTEVVTPFRFFSPSSVWNLPISAEASLDPNSAAMVSTFNRAIKAEEKLEKGPATINTVEWSVPVYTVPADQATVRVTLRDALPSSALQEAWDAVPLPEDAQPAAGTDKHLVVWQPSTNELWEFWRLERTGAGWQASWGGAIQDVSANSGAYDPEAWPGATTAWGASASSLSIAGGLITLEDLERGQINHALAMGIPEVRAGVYVAPAERTDGRSTNPLSLPEGAHLRLDPKLKLATLRLPRLTLMIAEAAQRYGIFIRDGAANVAFYAQDPIPTGTEPYSGPNGYFEGKTPSELLASFPWNHLQVLNSVAYETPK